MSKKYVHFELVTEKPDEKKIIEYMENKYPHFSNKVLFKELIKKDMEKSK